MFKINKTRKIVAGACAMMLIGALAGSAQTAMAATEGVTPVTYDNSVVVDVDGNGKWGVAIPAGLNFTDTKTTVTSEIELVGLNGTDLDAAYSKVEVTGKVTSAGGYSLTGPTGSTAASYKMTIDGKEFNQSAQEQTFQKKFGLGTASDGGTALDRRLGVSASLTEKGNLRGQYRDNLRFNFEGTATAKTSGR